MWRRHIEKQAQCEADTVRSRHRIGYRSRHSVTQTQFEADTESVTVRSKHSEKQT
jgi:hypothetical protein